MTIFTLSNVSDVGPRRLHPEIDLVRNIMPLSKIAANFPGQEFSAFTYVETPPPLREYLPQDLLPLIPTLHPQIRKCLDHLLLFFSHSTIASVPGTRIVWQYSRTATFGAMDPGSWSTRALLPDSAVGLLLNIVRALGLDQAPPPA